MSNNEPISATIEFKEKVGGVDVTPSYTGELSPDNEVHCLLVVFLSIISIDRRHLFTLFHQLLNDEKNKEKSAEVLKLLESGIPGTVTSLKNFTLH